MVVEGDGARIHRQPCVAGGDSGFVGICEIWRAWKVRADSLTALGGIDGLV